MRNPFRQDEDLLNLILHARDRIAALEAHAAEQDLLIEEFRIRLSGPKEQPPASAEKDSDWLTRRKVLEARFSGEGSNAKQSTVA